MAYSFLHNCEGHSSSRLRHCWILILILFCDRHCAQVDLTIKPTTYQDNSLLVSNGSFFPNSTINMSKARRSVVPSSSSFNSQSSSTANLTLLLMKTSFPRMNSEIKKNSFVPHQVFNLNDTNPINSSLRFLHNVVGSGVGSKPAVILTTRSSTTMASSPVQIKDQPDVILSKSRTLRNVRRNRKLIQSGANTTGSNALLSSDGRKILTILGLFEFNYITKTPLGLRRRDNGESERAAAQMALDDVNGNDKILSGYKLVQITNDTQCDPGTGVDAFFHALYSQKNSTKIIALLGTACDEVTERVSKVATHQRIVQVSFGSTSPSLSDRSEFPFFYRTVAPVSSHSEAIIELISHFNWDTVSFFTENENRYSMPVNHHLMKDMEEKGNITCKATLTFSLSDLQDQLDVLNESDSRIIIASFGIDIAPKVFCEVFKRNMFGPDFAWIWIGKPETIWWKDDTTTFSRFDFPSSFSSSRSRRLRTRDGNPSHVETQTRHAYNINNNIDNDTNYSPSSDSEVNGKTGANQYNLSRLRTKGVHGSRGDREEGRSTRKPSIKSELECSLKELTIAIENTLVVDRFNILDNARLSDFGLHGRQVNIAQNLIGEKLVFQLQPSVLSMFKHSSVAPSTDLIGLKTTESFGTRLRERMQMEKRLLMNPVSMDKDSINKTSISTLLTTSFAPESYDAIWAIAMGLEKLVEKHNYSLEKFNYMDNHFSNLLNDEIGKLKFTGISGPITFSGSDRIGITSFMQVQGGNLRQVGLFHPDREENKLELCSNDFHPLSQCWTIKWPGNQVPISRREFRTKLIRVEHSLYLIVAAVAFLGILLASAFLAFNLYYRKLKQMLKDTQLILLVMLLLLIDVIIVTSWAVVDPMHRHLQNLTLQKDVSDRSVVYQPQIEVCRSQHGHIWLSAMYAYKALLLVVGIYMSWETRHVKIHVLNDSKNIAYCVYIVVLTSVLAVSLANLVSERVTLSFVSVTSLILTSTTVTLCLLFLPKIHAIKTGGHKGDPVVESMGLKIEFNTRRLVVEDAKELMFRAEVQNRVYKRQIEAIDVEIWRLENLLLCSSHSSVASLDNNTNKSGKELPRDSKDSVSADRAEDMDSSEETSEIYTVLLHGPRFIVPISVLNFQNPNATLDPSSWSSKSKIRESGATLQPPPPPPRSSWPNVRSLLASSGNGLITKIRFKSEPKLLIDEPPCRVTKTCEMMETGGHVNININPELLLSPRVTFGGSDDSFGIGDDSGKSNISISKGKGSSRKSSNTSAGFSGSGGTNKKSFLTLLKQPFVYFSGMVRSGACSASPILTKKQKNGDHFRDETGGSDDEDEPQVFQLHVPRDSIRKKFNSVPDLWAVRTSPILHHYPKKTSIISDSVMDNSNLRYIMEANQPWNKLSSSSPVLKLTVTSDASPYL
ncbi:Gamma-aminobutyric acid type B receptor subunit 2 [Folsomia candida]|uniref:Gamma-aminobutyric acid type B receptor subunit 2 n=1 Tax=Folsomia candida TaxID=158441 RepID=A0A226ENL3_FOLCA|nr:Gamma-aminobutyric acid type B receptor subunit 2 [Folsomia candida]